MRFRECMVALPRFNPLKKPSAFWRKSGGYTKVNTNILKDFVGFFRCHEKPRRFGGGQGLGSEPREHMFQQPWGYAPTTLWSHVCNPTVTKP